MSFLDATIDFPKGRIAAFAGAYIARYTDPEGGWAAAHWDDTAHTRRRQASLFNGTLVPAPVFDTPIPSDPAEFTPAWRTAHHVADRITLGWPEAFLADLQRVPQPEPELFGGITVLEELH